MDHVQKARELFLKGYNCAQSVFAAFCDQTGMDEQTALRISSSFGGGMGRMREVCGALSGAFMVQGMVAGAYRPDDNRAKAAHYADIQKLAGQFRETFKTILCRELLTGQKPSTEPTPTVRDASFYKERPCLRFVEEAARLTDEWLAARETDLKKH